MPRTLLWAAIQLRTTVKPATCEAPPFAVAMICSGTLPKTCWLIAVDEDGCVFASPEYRAERLCNPIGRFVVRKVTFPAFTVPGFPYTCPLSKSCTVPVGVPLALTVTVKVTGVWKVTRLLEVIIVVVDGTGPPPPPPPPPPPHPCTTLIAQRTHPAANNIPLAPLLPPAPVSTRLSN